MERLDRLSKQIVPYIQYEYIIIGAGLAGLQSAEILATHRQKNDKSHSFLIIQANDYIGGRAKSENIAHLLGSSQTTHPQGQAQFQKLNDAIIQIGASLISKQHKAVLHWLSRLGLAITPAKPKQGLNVYGPLSAGSTDYLELQQTPTKLVYDYSEPTLAILEKMQSLQQTLRLIITQLQYNPNDLEAQRKYAQFAALSDNIIFKSQFLAQYIPDPQILDVLAAVLQVDQMIDKGDKTTLFEAVQLKFPLQSIRSAVAEAVNCIQNPTAAEMCQTYKIKQGFTALVEGLVKYIEKVLRQPRNNFFRLGQAVLKIDNSRPDKVIVYTTKNTYICRTVVNSAPISTFIPLTEISDSKRLFLEFTDRPEVIKVFCVFDTPFWKPTYTGSAMFMKDSLFSEMEDCSPTDGSCGILCLFVSGTRNVGLWETKFSTQLLPRNGSREEMVQEFMTDPLLDIFKCERGDQLWKKMVVVERSYRTNPYIQCCYHEKPKNEPVVYHLDASFKDALTGKTKNEHNVVYVGSQISSIWPTYAEGALQSARQKIFQHLGKQDPWLKVDQ